MAEALSSPVTVDTLMFDLPESTAIHLIPGERPALIDAGAAVTADHVIRALRVIGIETIDSILLTHIHFDHAGGTGHLLEAFPEATVHAPERVVRHLVDPSRLLEGVRAVWGERTDSLFGVPLPVSAERIVATRDGARIELGERTLKAIATPGHTRSHLAYLDETEGSIFCGDALGIKLPSVPVTRPATPPADFSFEDASDSIERIRASGAERLYIAHYGLLAGGVEPACDEALAALGRWRELFDRERFEATDTEDLHRRVNCALEAGLEPLRPAQRMRLDTVNPAWLNLEGMTAAAERTSAA